MANLSFMVPGLAAGNHTVQVKDTITGVLSNPLNVTVAAQQNQGGSGGGTSTPGSLPVVQVNAVAAMPVGTPVTLGHFFAKGDVPSGYFNKLTGTISGHTFSIQVDQTNAWLADGSLRFASLSFLMPVALAAGATAPCQLGTGSAAISGTAITLAQVTGASNGAGGTRNFLTHVTGGSSSLNGQVFGSDVFQVGFNDVVANLGQASQTLGWGSNSPLGGWEVIRSGPICSEWRVWRYLKRVSDGASHGMVRVAMYLRAWSDGAGGIQGFEPLVGMQQHNSYGPVSGATVGTVLDSYTGNVSLMDGSTTIKQFTGPSGNQNVYTNPQRGWWSAESDGRRTWVSQNGSARPSYMVAFDQQYAINTKCLPPYPLAAVQALKNAGQNLSLQSGAANYQPVYTVNVSTFSLELTAHGDSINTTGDDQTDVRYGYLNNNATSLFLNQLDAARYNTVLADGWGLADWEYHTADERYGVPLNNSLTGPMANMVATPNGGFAMYNNGTGSGANEGSPAWQGCGNALTNGSYHGFNYGPNFDWSHWPCLWVMPYLLTGDAAFEEEAMYLNVSIPSGGSYTCNFNFGTGASVQFDIMPLKAWSIETAERAGGNQIRQLGQSNRMARDTNLMREYPRHAQEQISAFCAMGPNWPQNAQYSYEIISTPDMIALGQVWETRQEGMSYANGGNQAPSLFMMSDLMGMLAIEARVNEYPGYQNLVNIMQPICIGLYAEANGSSSANLTTYNVATAQSASAAYPNIAAVITANGLNNYPATGFADNGYAQSTILLFPLMGILLAGWTPSPPAQAIAVAQEAKNRLAAYNPSNPAIIPMMDGVNAIGGNFGPQLAVAWPPGVT